MNTKRFVIQLTLALVFAAAASAGAAQRAASMPAPGLEKGGRVTDGGAGASNAFAFPPNGVSVWNAYSTPVKDSTTIRFKLKPLCDARVHHFGTDYLDIWRVQAKMDGTNTDADVLVCIEAFQKLHKAGKVRHLGVSSHSRPWAQHVVEKYPEVEMFIFPCTAKTGLRKVESKIV